MNCHCTPEKTCQCSACFAIHAAAHRQTTSPPPDQPAKRHLFGPRR
ncbi:hypothetical protein [Streptosporangium sandarakinum]|uniref:Uncharacterized protein n=1 Tax=Streptosporangium sandarakinum TaxID=1260955 RepID=A0A852VE96_9ACTN|nr:hypothetical protein [Streptosporangium sandarakinum]